MIGSLPAIECACLLQVICVLLLGRVIKIDAHHVLEVVTTRPELRPVCNASTCCLLKNGLVLGHKAFHGLMIESTRNLAFEAFRRVVRVALTIEVLRVDARDESSVARDALVADVVHGAIYPCHTGFAHIATHGITLRFLGHAINRVRSHRLRNLLVLHDGRTRLNHSGLVEIAEVLARLPVSLASRLADNVLLERNKTRVARNLQVTLHSTSSREK